MAKLDSNFTAFLAAIEPDPKAVEHAIDAHTPIRKHLESDDSFKEHVKDTFLYGSYKRHTSTGDIKDVDIVVLTDFDPDKEGNDPQTVLRTLKTAINRHYKDTENQQYQRRSIRVDDPLPEKPEVKLTLDIIPAYAPNGDDQPLRVPDRELKDWVWSHPKGHINYVTTLNDGQHGKGKFVPLAKIVRWWWKHQCEVRQPNVERPKPKGFWVEVMAGQFFDQSQSDYGSHFIAVLEKALAHFDSINGMSQLDDPGLRGLPILTSMTQKEYGIFLQTMKESLETAKKALAEPDELSSSILWQKVFGGKFHLAKGGTENMRNFPPPSMPGPKTPPIPPRKREAG